MHSVRVAECILFHNYLGNGNYFYEFYLYVFNSKRNINLLASFFISLPTPTFFSVRNPFRMLDRKLQFSKVLFFFLRSMYSAVFQTDLGIFYAILRIFKILLRIFYTQKQLICKLKIFCSSKNIHISLWQKFSMQKCPYSALKMEKLCIVAVVHNSNQIYPMLNVKSRYMCKNRV